jgi:aerotaxis receptor
VIRKFENTDIEFFFSESNENGNYTFESDKFIQIDGRDKEALSKLDIKAIRSQRVPQYIFDEMYHWSRTKGFWTGILENEKKDGTTYWINASIIKIHAKDGSTKYGMISTPASHDEIETTKEHFKILNGLKFDKIWGLTKMRYPVFKDSKNIKSN